MDSSTKLNPRVTTPGPKFLLLSGLTIWLALVCFFCVSSPQTLVSLVQAFGDIEIQKWDKLGHFALYIVGGLLLFGLRKTYNLGPILTAMLILTLCLLGEVVQMVTPARSYLDIKDFTSNLGGCTLGILLPLLITKPNYGKTQY